MKVDKEQQEEFIKEMAEAVANEPWRAVPVTNLFKGLGQNPDKAENRTLILQYQIDLALAYINKSVDTSRDQCRNGMEELYWDIIDHIKYLLERKSDFGDNTSEEK